MLCDAIWQRILELCPELRDNLRAVWTDFEQAAVASLRHNFPLIRIRGCWFHFCRVSLSVVNIRFIDYTPALGHASGLGKQGNCLLRTARFSRGRRETCVARGISV